MQHNNHYKLTSALLFIIMLYSFFIILKQDKTIRSQARDIIWLRQENLHLKEQINIANDYYDISGCVKKVKL